MLRCSCGAVESLRALFMGTLGMLIHMRDALGRPGRAMPASWARTVLRLHPRLDVYYNLYMEFHLQRLNPRDLVSGPVRETGPASNLTTACKACNCVTWAVQQVAIGNFLCLLAIGSIPWHTNTSLPSTQHTNGRIAARPWI